MTKRVVALVAWMIVLGQGLAGAQPPGSDRGLTPGWDVPRAEASAHRAPWGTSTGDSVLDGLGRGAAVGAVAALPLAIAQMKSCDTGCDWSSTAALMIGWSILGAGAGAAVGLAADYDARDATLQGLPEQPAPRFFPTALSPRVGLAFSTVTPRTSALTGHSTGPAVTFAMQLSPHISVHAEYLSVGATFAAAQGAIPDEVVRNVVPASTRVAGRTYGIESRRIDYILTELVGIHPAPWGRLRLEFLGGIGVQGEEDRSYYDAYRPVPGQGNQPVPGKYYVLDFESPEVGLVLGVDAELAIAGGIRLVPTVRYNAMENSSASISFGAGMHWRF